MRFQTKTIPRILTASVLLCGIVLRGLGAWWYRNDSNPDYAVVVEMVRHMARGIDWPVFFYGQAYMGSLEPTASVLFAWLGGPSPFMVCLGTAFFGVLLLLAIRRWAADAAGPWAGLLAMAAAIIGPPGYFQYMGSPRGGYALGLLLIVVLLREGCRIAAAETAADREERPCIPARRYARLGLLGGLAFWNFWLVLPALATTGLLLVATLRWRVLRRRVLLPGIGGFLVGSLPFWIYNIAHDWASFAPTSSGSAGLSEVPAIAKALLSTRLPALLDTGRGPLWNGALQISLAALAVTGAAVLAAGRPGRRQRRNRPADWMLPAMAVFSCLFLTAYFLSSFGCMNTPRYLLVFIPLLAVLGGVAPVRLASAARRLLNGGPIRRIAGLGSGALALLLVAGPLACHIASVHTHLRKNVRNGHWRQRTETLATALRERGIRIAVGDYKIWGANWVSDENPVFCSPRLERYRPFALALENAESAAVVENFHGFSNFIEGTGGEVERIPGAGVRVMANARPPRQDAVTLPPSTIGEILENGSMSIGAALTDQMYATIALLVTSPGRDSTAEIILAKPTTLCGLRLWPDKRNTFDRVVVEVPGPDGAWGPLTTPCVDSGFHWYGPTFYWGGPQHHVDLRFPPVETSRLRLRFSSRSREVHVILRELALLGPAPAPPPVDIESVARSLTDIGAKRIYANRWIAARLRPLLPDSVWLSPLPRRDVPGDELASARLVPDTGSIVLSPPETVGPIRRGLDMMNAAIEEVPMGGLTAFVLKRAESERLAAYDGAFFLGCTVVHATPVELAAVRGETPPPEPAMIATYEDGAFGIVDFRVATPSVRPGDTIGIDIEWHFSLRESSPPHYVLQGLHFLRDGKVVFQQDIPFLVELDGVAPDGNMRYVSRFSTAVPEGMTGQVVPAFCLYRRGIRNRRLKPDTELEMSRRRILLPPITIQTP